MFIFKLFQRQGQQSKDSYVLNKWINSWAQIDFSYLNTELGLKMQSRNGKDYFLDNF